MEEPYRFIQVADQLFNLRQVVYARHVAEAEELTIWLHGYSEPLFFKGEDAELIFDSLARRAETVVWPEEPDVEAEES